MLKQQDQQYRDNVDEQRSHHDQLCVQLQSGNAIGKPVAAVFPHSGNIPPYDKTDVAHENEENGGEIDERIGQETVIACFAEQIKSCIAEGGDGMEHGIPDAFGDTVLRYEAEGKKEGTDQFHTEGTLYHATNESAHVVHVIQAV